MYVQYNLWTINYIYS